MDALLAIVFRENENSVRTRHRLWRKYYPEGPMSEFVPGSTTSSVDAPDHEEVLINQLHLCWDAIKQYRIEV